MSFKYKELILGEEFADLLRTPTAQVEVGKNIDTLGAELIENLNQQLALYSAYLEQANRQRLALMNRQLAENGQVNVESERLIGKLTILEESRIVITEKILGPAQAMESAKGGHKVKCEVIYPLLSAERASQLKTTRDALVKAIAELKKVLNINMAMVENGSRIVHTTVAIMTSVVGRKKHEKMHTYTSQGSVRMAKVQVRNLINRSV
jgi:hypothetical protein